MKLRPRVVVLDDYEAVAESFADWERLPCEVTFVHEHVADREALVALLHDAPIVSTLRDRTAFDAALLARLPQLELIAAKGSGSSQGFLDVAAANTAGIVVSISGDNGEPDPSSTTELTLGLMIAIARKITLCERRARLARWEPAIGTRLHGKTLGTVGVGTIGRQISRLARALGMDVIAWSPNITPERAAAAGARMVSKEELFRTADFVTLHLRLVDSTREIVTARELGWMKRSAFLINTSRGPLVREADLIAALRSGTLAGAALDVFHVEPLPAGHPLLGLDNVVLTPHIGYMVEDQLRHFYRRDVENIEAWLAGEPARVYNPAALGVARPRSTLGLARSGP